MKVSQSESCMNFCQDVFDGRWKAYYGYSIKQLAQGAWIKWKRDNGRSVMFPFSGDSEYDSELEYFTQLVTDNLDHLYATNGNWPFTAFSLPSVDRS